MRSFFTRSFFAAVLLLSGGIAGAGDLPTPNLASCVQQLGGDADLALELCQARRLRSILAPGDSSCVGGWRLINGNISCHKSDSASDAAASETVFSRSSLQLGAPVSLGTLSDFYSGRKAGEGGRFHVVQESDGGLALVDSSDTDALSDRACVFAPGDYQCTAKEGLSLASTGWSNYVYTLQLDGLVIDKTMYTRRCTQTRCAGICICVQHGFVPSGRTRSLHLWQRQ